MLQIALDKFFSQRCHGLRQNSAFTLQKQPAKVRVFFHKLQLNVNQHVYFINDICNIFGCLSDFRIHHVEFLANHGCVKIFFPVKKLVKRTGRETRSAGNLRHRDIMVALDRKYFFRVFENFGTTCIKLTFFSFSFYHERIFLECLFKF